MIFSSAEFIFYFLPVAFGAFWIANALNRQAALAVLCISSFAFYAYWKWEYVFLFAGSIAANYLCYRALRTWRKPAILKIGIIANLALIGVFKYAGFFVSDVAQLDRYAIYVENIVLPLGISFFTFQQISFLVDTSAHTAGKSVSLLRYCAYVSFFPQLIAGPIVRQDELLHQFDRKLELRDNMLRGMLLFAIGLAKKVIIADTLSVYVGQGFDAAHTLTALDAWALTFLYTFQLYFDFSGYSDMAIGLALLFGLQLPQNFNSPYQATSIQGFWRRWHMTLSRWLKDYLYIPLGGSRHGPVRTYLALLATMFLGGLWHGAGWTFVVWGTLHGLALAVNRAWSRAGLAMPPALGWLVTFIFVANLWVIFRAEDFGTAWTIYVAMWSPSSVLGLSGPHDAVFAPQLWLALAALTAMVTMLPNSWQIDRFCKQRHRAVIAVASQYVAGVVFMLAVKRMSEASAPSEFIYFQF